MLTGIAPIKKYFDDNGSHAVQDKAGDTSIHGGGRRILIEIAEEEGKDIHQTSPSSSN